MGECGVCGGVRGEHAKRGGVPSGERGAGAAAQHRQAASRHQACSVAGDSQHNGPRSMPCDTLGAVGADAIGASRAWVGAAVRVCGRGQLAGCIGSCYACV